MPTYDHIDGQRYDKQRESSLFAPERDSILGLAGDLRTRTVVDLACGSGVYARLARRAGAARVVGVDVSAGMLAVARRHEARERLGITYVHADVRALPLLGTFDVALAVWLFGYAEDAGALQAMAASAATLLAPRGRLVALTINPDFALGDDGWGGWTTSSLAQRRVDDDCVEYTLLHDAIRITFRQWSRAAYEAALSAAGLGRAAWHPIAVPPRLIDGPQGVQWRQFVANPPMIALTATHDRSEPDPGSYGVVRPYRPATAAGAESRHG
ncbi:class I SAM-dependent methyltransferase [Micromonospora auratinigra]|uniref:Methyltransferase domain-containing protein n=1 Tax=Micromonospora auratinigra TaxID=261654 RepID=A0A1A8Z4J0_9ACTN|nr:class I SAM-dependent methyltransferase [Micromonospora auratinigra]SBT38771.1 Methyltransferase domain-containing protein [Micromonospora auratinigra]